MIREVVKIDEELCDGCGLCVPGCHEGALQVIDGKARLISDLMCDGLGACLGHCPQDAISIEKREAEPYNESKVMEMMVGKGRNTVLAHLMHLKEHNETEYLQEGVRYLRANEKDLNFSLSGVLHEVHGSGRTSLQVDRMQAHSGGGCPGSRSMDLSRPFPVTERQEPAVQASALEQWPVQLHLINPMAPFFRQADLLLAADCTAFAMGDFHHTWLKGKKLAIACPKLDTQMQSYVEKIAALIDSAELNTITVMIMQVPCCGGLLQVVSQAQAMARRKVPVKLVVVGLQGEVLKEEWQ